MSLVPTKDPAIRSYFFGKGYRDLRATIIESWQRNVRSAQQFFSKAPGGDDPEEMFQSGVWVAAGVSTLIFGTAFFACASAIHVLLLGLIFLLVYVGFSILWLVERGYLGIRSFFMACPHCHERSTIPEYFCDGCGAVHARLLPNSYGITFHLCECGKRLPATFFLNRGRLQARCPSCHENIAREHVESRRIFIPVMGGPSAGKSAFLFGAVRQLIDREADALGFKAEPFDKRSERAYHSLVGLLQSGRPPDKTHDPIPRAFNLALHKNGRLAFLLYLYDPAGEAYQDADKLAAHRFHKYLSGMILIVDPFAIPEVRSRYEAELKHQHGSLKPSDLRIEDAVDRLLLTLEADFGLSKRGRVRPPLAVVLNKVDAFDLENIVGETAVDRAVAAWKGDRPADRDAVRNSVLKEQLSKWGEQAFVSRIEGRFSNVRYFSCSALGRMPDGSGADFAGTAVLPPLLWIFGHADPASFGRDSPRPFVGRWIAVIVACAILGVLAVIATRQPFRDSPSTGIPTRPEGLPSATKMRPLVSGPAPKQPILSTDVLLSPSTGPEFVVPKSQDEPVAGDSSSDPPSQHTVPQPVASLPRSESEASESSTTSSTREEPAAAESPESTSESPRSQRKCIEVNDKIFCGYAK